MFLKIAMLAGFIIVPIVSLLSPKPKKELVEEMFACYNRTVIVPVKESFGD